MDEKRRNFHEYDLVLDDPMRVRRRRTAPILGILILVVLYSLFFVDTSTSFPLSLLGDKAILPHLYKEAPRNGVGSKTAQSNVTRVPLEAHIMSKCPDARDCLRDLIVPTMVQLADRIDFRLSYIGKVNNDDTVSCMHGQTECLGNIIGLCADNLYPNSSEISLGFANCMIADYRQIPSGTLVKHCALEHGVDFEKLNGCVSSADGTGLDLLKHSVERSIEKNVTLSCTVRLNDKIRCIRDGAEWKDCEGGSDVTDLVQDVNDLYKKLNGKS